MNIRLQSVQVPEYWEIIKYAAVNADAIEQENISVYCNELLINLLSGKACAMFKLDSKTRKILAVLVYELRVNKTTQKKHAWFNILYAFENVELQDWVDAVTPIISSLKQEGCEQIIFESINPRLITMAENAGFELKTKTYTLKL